jgi:hypothetical protein
MLFWPAHWRVSQTSIRIDQDLLLLALFSGSRVEWANSCLSYAEGIMAPIAKAFGMILFGFILSGYASEGRTVSAGNSSETTDRSAQESSSAKKAPGWTSDRDRSTSGAVEDTLMACLAGIPKAASAGQKMLAEQSCHQEAERTDLRANSDRIASGAVEDTLMACLARIPKDASAGQRMLAEESCRRDHVRR